MKHIIFLTIISIWKVLPFKQFHAKILIGFPKIFSKLYKDLRFRGVMNVSVENKSFLLHNPGFTTIENEIFWFGLENGWEKVSMKLWIELVKNSNTILDIGANTGVYSLVAATVNNHAKVYDEFIQVIAGKQKQYVTGEEGLQSVKMIEQLYKAAK